MVPDDGMVRVGGRHRAISKEGFTVMSRKGPNPVMRIFGGLGAAMFLVIVGLVMGQCLASVGVDIYVGYKHVSHRVIFGHASFLTICC